MRFLMNLHNDESGQDLVEYALVLAAVIAALVIGAPSLSTAIQGVVTALTGKIDAAMKTL